MTKEEIKHVCMVYDDIRRQRDAATIGYNSEDAFWEHITVMCNLSKLSLPSNLDEAAEEFSDGEWDGLHDNDGNTLYTEDMIQYAFKAGAEWRDSQIPKLPDNLDGAAEEAAKAWRKNPDGSESREIFFLPFVRGFKAGVKWLSEQGIKRD